ncbi:hypothetical protein V1527DRAFT_27611 [Lipomyces starkeyi]
MTLAPDLRASRPHGGGVHDQASSSSSLHHSSSTISAPAASPVAPTAAPPVCQNCATSTTPLWRRDESGQVLCNACGLFLKLHGRPRPISLKTDVIKSRNRIKNPHHAASHGHGHGHGHGQSHGQTNGSGATPNAHAGSASSVNGTGSRKKHEVHANSSNVSPNSRPPQPASEADAGGLMHLAQALHEQQQLQQQLHDSRMMQQPGHLPSLSAAIKEESSPSMQPVRGSPLINAQGHHLLAPTAGPVSPLLPVPHALGPSDMLTPPENSPPVVPQLGQQQRHPSAQQFYDARSPAMPQMQKPPHLSSQAQGAQQAIPSPVLLPLPHASTPHAGHSSTPLGDPATPPSASLPPLVRRSNTPPHLSLAGQHEHEISPLVPAKSAIALAQARGHSPPATLAPIMNPMSASQSVNSSVTSATAPASITQSNAALSGSTTHTTMESLVTANQTLRTRVSELELVNDLFRSRISELESNEASARKSELTRRELESQLQRKLEESGQKNLELQSRVEELEMEKERLATEREMKFREHQLMQQQQLLHPHLHHQLPKLPLPQTPASPALETNLEDSESQHMRKKMRVSDLVGGSNETGGSSATPPQPPQSASRTGTPLQQILSPQVSHHQSHTQHLIPPLQLSPSNGNSNGGYNINGVNGINRISLPSVSSITLPPITAPGDGNGSAR